MTSIGKKTEAFNAYLIKNSKGEKGGGEHTHTHTHTHTQRGGGGEGVGRKAVGRTGRNCMGV